MERKRRLFKELRGASDEKINRNGEILCCLRKDKEATLTKNEQDAIKKYISEDKGRTLRDTNTVLPESIYPDKDVYDKISEFAKADFVVTDRLHGMIFAAITGTPCIVFQNYNHKVLGEYQWIKHLEYVKLVADFEKFKESFADLLSSLDEKQFTFHLPKENFEPLRKELTNWFDSGMN